MCIFLLDIFSSIKEINRLKSKGMSGIYYREKLTFSKLRFSQKENLKKYTSLKSKKVQGIFKKTIILALSSSAVFPLQKRVSDFF